MFFFNTLVVNQKEKAILFLFNVLTSCLYQEHLTHNKLNVFTDLLQCYPKLQINYM